VLDRTVQISNLHRADPVKDVVLTMQSPEPNG